MVSKLAQHLVRDIAPRTYAELCSLSSRSTVDRAIAAGDIVRLVPDQYCLAVHAGSWAMRARAATSWLGPGAAVGGLAAFAVFGYTPLEIDKVDVVVPWGPGRRRGPEWLRMRSITVPFPTANWVPRTEVVIPEYALALAYSHIPRGDRASFVHGAAHATLITPHTMMRALDALPRVKGRAELTRRVGLMAAGAESYLEERGIVDVFRGEGFDDLTAQHWVRVRGEWFRLDMVHLATRTVFELDGAGAHGKPQTRQADVRRDAMLATLGFLVVRFTYADITERAEWCREIALEVIAARTVGA